jgi:hypothetical protein
MFFDILITYFYFLKEMEKARVRSTVRLINENVLLRVLSKIKNKVNLSNLTETMEEFISHGYSVVDSARITFMLKWNNDYTNRVKTLPLYLHEVYYVVEKDEYYNGIGSLKIISTKKDLGYVSKYLHLNYSDMKINDLLDLKNVYRIGEIENYCEYLNIYKYDINDIIKVNSTQIL